MTLAVVVIVAGVLLAAQGALGVARDCLGFFRGRAGSAVARPPHVCQFTGLPCASPSGDADLPAKSQMGEQLSMDFGSFFSKSVGKCGAFAILPGGLLPISTLEGGVDVDAFVAGFEAVCYIAIGTIAAFAVLSFIRKFFG